VTAGEIVAIYAAVASTGALGWQVYSWLHSRSTRVEVRVDMGMTEEPRGTLIAVTAVNRSEHPIRIASAGLFAPGGDDLVARNHPDIKGAIPGDVAARDSGIAHFHLQELQHAGFDLTQPIAGYAWLSTGERIESAPGLLNLSGPS
jgi:hypothetical protein